MTRTIDAAAIAELTKTQVKPALLATLDFASGMLRVWSGVGPLVYDGETYLGVGTLGEISPLEESGQGMVRATNLTMRLSGIPSTYLSLALTEEYQGREVTVSLGFFTPETISPVLEGGETFIDTDVAFVDTDVAFVDGGTTWTYESTLTVIPLWVGRMDVMMIDEGPETSAITVTAESELADLKRPRVRRYTHEDQQQLYPGDMGFEFVSGVMDLEIGWGTGAVSPRTYPKGVSG